MKIELLFLFLCHFYLFQLQAQPIKIHKIETNLVVDGDLSDWTIPFSKQFVIYNSSEKTTQETTVALSWNNQNLYIAYKCDDFNIKGSVQENDSPIFRTDDLVEIFIDPDGDSKNYIEIGVNAFSTHYDMLINCSSSNCGGWKADIDLDIKGIQAVSKINKNGYTVEISIPFTSLNTIAKANFKTPTTRTKWKGNLFRIDYCTSVEYQSLQPYSSKKQGFHQPKAFADFEFVD